MLFLDFQTHTWKLFSSVSAFILYLKKMQQQKNQKPTINLILVAHLLHYFCVISFILSSFSRKIVPSHTPALDNITGDAAGESYLMFPLVALLFC